MSLLIVGSLASHTEEMGHPSVLIPPSPCSPPVQLSEAIVFAVHEIRVAELLYRCCYYVAIMYRTLVPIFVCGHVLIFSADA